MATIVIPPLMRDLTGGQARVQVSGRTVRAVVDALDARVPGAKARLCRGDALLPSLTVVIDGRISRLGLWQPVNENSEIRFVPAIEGG